MPCAFSRNPESTERVISVEPFTPASAIVECVRGRRSAAAVAGAEFSADKLAGCVAVLGSSDTMTPG